MDDPVQIQLKEMAKKIKDLQACDKGKKVFTSKDFYKSITPVRNNQDSKKTNFVKAHREGCKDSKENHTSQKEKSLKQSGKKR